MLDPCRFRLLFLTPPDPRRISVPPDSVWTRALCGPGRYDPTTHDPGGTVRVSLSDSRADSTFNQRWETGGVPSVRREETGGGEKQRGT